MNQAPHPSQALRETDSPVGTASAEGKNDLPEIDYEGGPLSEAAAQVLRQRYAPCSDAHTIWL